MENLENRIEENSSNTAFTTKTYELDLSKIDYIANPNVRKVAMLAKDVKDRMNKGEYTLDNGYSEAYSGESA